MLIWEDHWQVQRFLGNHCKFQWFWINHCKFSMVFEETITIECFLAVSPLPPMVFQWFFILLPSLSMVFDGSGPLVKRCDGFDGSLWSNAVRSPDRAVGTKARCQCQRWCRPTSSPPCSSSPPCCSQHQTPPPNGCFAHQQPILESQSHIATCLKDTD